MPHAQEPNLQESNQPSSQQGKLRRALKDISSISLYAPDNHQIGALKAEIQQMMVVQKVNTDSSSESEG